MAETLIELRDIKKSYGSVYRARRRQPVGRHEARWSA